MPIAAIQDTNPYLLVAGGLQATDCRQRTEQQVVLPEIDRATWPYFPLALLRMGMGSGGHPTSEKLPSFRDFHRRVCAGKINLADNDLKIRHDMALWEQLLQNMRRPRFDEALAFFLFGR